MKKDTSFVDSSQDALDWLMYSSYVFQRERSPHIQPTRWRTLYLSQEAFEVKYQKEKKDE